MTYCDCGVPARVQTLVRYESGTIEVYWTCEAHALRLARQCARLGYNVRMA